jgi:hypothetical protein
MSAKWEHRDHSHYYYVNRDMWGFTVRQYIDGAPGPRLEMDDSQYQNFERMLVEGGWDEQPT